ncbi:MAG: SWIM zinc finger domain-containing protein [Lachnospirales bacterium]
MEWKRLFESHILERGYDYYADRAVCDFEVSENNIIAQVSGYDLYDVEIEIENDEITDMHCTCPYAEGGSNCKHMAAVLYKYENYDKESTSYESIDNIVNSADEGVVRAFLTDILKNSNRLFLKFKNMISTEVSREDVKKLKNEINCIIDSYSDRHGFIDYRSAWDFSCDILDIIINDNINMFVDKGYLEESFDLVIYILKLVGNIDIDDSDGGIGMILSKCCDIIRHIISKSDICMKEKVYLALIEYTKENYTDFFDDSIEDILIYEFEEEEFIIRNLDFTDKMLREFEININEWSNYYSARAWFNKHIRLMEMKNISVGERIDYCIKHWKLPDAREFCINEYCKRKEYDKAIEILNESIKIDAAYPGLVSDYKYRLKDIYKTIGDTKKYVSFLWELIFYGRDFNLYNELKKQYSNEEWLEKREVLFNGLKNKPIVAEFYKEEKLYDRLLSYVIGSSGLYELDKYKSVLIKLYPSEVLKKYKYELEKMAERVADRNHYKEWVLILRDMKKIEGGKEVVNDIVDRWKAIYKKRRAMMEELNKL